MENPEGVLNLLDEFAKLKSKEIPSDLEEYLSYVAASGDPVYQWSLIKSLYRQKLINVITEFYEMCPVVEIPRCPNVDPFNYETMKNSLLKRLDSFSSAPFTIQRISELLTTPRKQYNRVDKFMRAIEKNIWVVSTREPGSRDSSSTPQETSASLVNGVTPRVSVTVKHPKRIKSIEERIKSGHPQLIDDEEEEEEDDEEEGEGEEMDEYEQMVEEVSAEILPSNEVEETSLQCTSVKDLIEKYENGTIFSNSEEKTDFEEKSVQLEGVPECETSITSVTVMQSEEAAEVAVAAAAAAATETATETETTTPTIISSLPSSTILTSSDSLPKATHDSDSQVKSICQNTDLVVNQEAAETYIEKEKPPVVLSECESEHREVQEIDSSQAQLAESEKTNDVALSVALDDSVGDQSQPVGSCLVSLVSDLQNSENNAQQMVIDEVEAAEPTSSEMSVTSEQEQTFEATSEDQLMTFDAVQGNDESA